jgi:hypothetical protein
LTNRRRTCVNNPRTPLSIISLKTNRFGSLARSFGEANRRYQALAVEVGRAVEIQSQFVGKAYENYIAEMSKIGRMFLAGYNAFIPRSQALPPANLNERKAADGQPSWAKAKVNSKPRRRAAAPSMSPKRKTGTVARSQRAPVQTA